MTIFETEEDLRREKKAIELFVSLFKGSYRKLDPLDIDFKIYDKNSDLVGYVEVKGRLRNMSNAYPLQISARKLIKLLDKRMKAIVVWACDDGIIYANPMNLRGDIKWGGRAVRENSTNDLEMMVYYDRQKEFKYVRYP